MTSQGRKRDSGIANAQLRQIIELYKMFKIQLSSREFFGTVDDIAKDIAFNDFSVYSSISCQNDENIENKNYKLNIEYLYSYNNE